MREIKNERKVRCHKSTVENLPARIVDLHANAYI